MLRRIIISLLLIVLSSHLSSAQSVGVLSHATVGHHSTIQMDGVLKHTKVMQITDSHITCAGEEDKQYEPNIINMAHAYEHVNHYLTGQEISWTAAFSELMDSAIANKVDLIVLTGDIVNYPSSNAVKFVLTQLERTQRPFIYIAGNHDWDIEGMSGTGDDRREIWRKKVLLPLYQGENPSYNSHVMNGIIFVAIDNSTYKISKEQLRFYNKEKELGLPIVLLMHIPIYSKTGRNDGRIGDSMSDSITNEFTNEVGTTPGVLVLVGHLHRYEEDTEGTMLQLITGYSRDASARMIDFLPN